jgi:GMP synthase (glutamine-hydrolysing)
MKPILIIKTGSTFPEISRDRGDFEDWIITGMGLERNKFLIVDVSQGESLPDYNDISGIVITGSHDNVTDHYDWSERTAHWLPEAVERKFPLLGICYGHQLLAYALGGQVEDNPNGLEFGAVEIKLTDAAKQDRLFSLLSSSVYFQATHTQSVIKLPINAKLLASTSLDPNHAFVVGDCCWGVQFHPEFDVDIVRRYIAQERNYLQAKRLRPDELIESCFETPFGEQFLKKFGEIVKN